MDAELLRHLDDQTRRAVLAGTMRRKFSRGEVIFHDGDPGDSLHIIEQGAVGVRLTTRLGDIALVNVLGPGDWFGELSVLAPAPRTGTVYAVVATQTRTLRADAVADLRARHPTVTEALITGLVSDVRRLTGQLVDAAYLPVDKRVVLRMVDLAVVFGDGSDEVVVPLTQEQMAQLVGTTRPAANKVLSELADAGILSVGRGRVVVRSIEALRGRC